MQQTRKYRKRDDGRAAVRQPARSTGYERKHKSRGEQQMEALGASANYQVIKDSGNLSYVSTEVYGTAGVAIAVSDAIDNSFARLVNSPLRGSAFFNRLSNKSFGKYLWLRGDVNFAGTGIAATLRLVVVYDKNANGALPTAGFADIMTDFDRQGTTVTDVYTKRSHATIDRYITLMDKYYIVNDDFAPKLNIDEFIKLKGLQTTFSGDTNNAAPQIGDISTGSLLVYAISDRGAASNPPTLRLRSTYCFADK